ncbi:UNVERIFIED_CONTAM: hypothetical protein K2H54_050021 [Gekko kuhli]
MEAASLASYGLALLHPQGFELALGGHILTVLWKVFRAQRHLGDATSAGIVALGLASCLGFVCLKLWDQELAQWALFRRLTGHFWSKICDVLQFHCAFLFCVRLGSPHRSESVPRLSTNQRTGATDGDDKGDVDSVAPGRTRENRRGSSMSTEGQSGAMPPSKSCEQKSSL